MESGWTSRPDTYLTQKRCMMLLNRRKATDYYKNPIPSSILQRILLNTSSEPRYQVLLEFNKQRTSCLHTCAYDSDPDPDLAVCKLMAT